MSSIIQAFIQRKPQELSISCIGKDVYKGGQGVLKVPPPHWIGKIYGNFLYMPLIQSKSTISLLGAELFTFFISKYKTKRLSSGLFFCSLYLKNICEMFFFRVWMYSYRQLMDKYQYLRYVCEKLKFIFTASTSQVR